MIVRDVAVVGGGISGLAAAWALQQRGLSTIVLEADRRFGGVIRSEREDGFTLDAAADAILAQKPEGVALCRALGLGDRLMPTNLEQRTVYVMRRGRLHPLPEGMTLAVPTRVLPVLRSRLFSWPGKVRMGLEPLVPLRRDASDESIASFVGRRLGREAVELLGQPLLAGIHAGDAEQLSMRSTFPRFVDMEARGVSLLRGVATMPRPEPGTSAFQSLPGGMNELVAALVSALMPHVALDSRVHAIERTASGYRLSSGGGAVDARAVVVAVPAPRAAPLLEPHAPAAAEVLRSIRFVSSATILLGFRRHHVGHPLDGYGLLVPRAERLRLTACSFLSTKLPGRAPEGHALLRAFVGGAHDEPVLALSDDALVALALRELSPPLAIHGEPVLARVFRWPAGTPQMEVGHGARIAGLEAAMASVRGLFVIGAGLRGTGIPDCISDANRAAVSVSAYLA